MIGDEFVTLGFVVKASVQGRRGPQDISKRYTSKAAAEAYRDLAVRQGFCDAFVAGVDGLEMHAKVGGNRGARRMLPPDVTGEGAA